MISLFYEELKTRPTGSKKKVFAALQGELDPAEDDCFDEELELETEDDKNVLSDNPSLIVGMAMKKLPEVLRTPVVLRELEGLNYEEIAILTKTEVGTVKSRIAKARGMLERMLSNYLNNSVDQAEVKG